ncbi:hypothetical protein KBA27_02155 [bacterium]|nr:hypothetical protein [bacterium]
MADVSAVTAPQAAPIKTAGKAEAPKDTKETKKAGKAEDTKKTAPATDKKAAPAPQAPTGDSVAHATPTDKQAKKLDVHA